MRNWIFAQIHWLVSRHPLSIIVAALASAAALGGYGVANMQMITDQDRLLSEDLDYHKRYMDFIRRFGDLEFLYVLIEGPDEIRMVEFADRLSQRLSGHENIGDIIYKYDTHWVKPFALHYASDGDIDALKQEIVPKAGEIRDLAEIRNLDHVLRKVSDSITLDATASAMSDNDADSLDWLIDALRGEGGDSFAELAKFRGDFDGAFSGSAEYQWLSGKKYLLMLIMPSKDFTTLSVIEKPLHDIRAAIDLTESEMPAVAAGLTGRPALQADEMTATNNDMFNASITALIGVAALFILFFRELARPILAVAALLIAMGWTYGFVALSLGHLNLLSLVFALVLIGLGIDFGIHYLHRYQEELEKCKDASLAVRNALLGAGSGIVTGAVTSSVAFLLAMTTDFLGLAELGQVAGAGILFCLIAMLIVLSAFLIGYDRHFRASSHVPAPLHLMGLRHASRHPKTLLALIALATLALLPSIKHVRFEDNLLLLQADNLESVEYEKKLLDETEQSTWYAAFLCDSLERVQSVSAALQTKATVADVQAITSLLPWDSAQRALDLKAVSDALRPVAALPAPWYSPNPYIAQELRDRLSRLFSLLDQRDLWLEKKAEAEQRMKDMQAQMEQNAAQAAPDGQPFPDGMEMDPAMLQAMRSQPGAAHSLMPEIVIPEVEISADLLARLKELHSLLAGTKQEVSSRLTAANARWIERPIESLQWLNALAQTPAPDIDSVPDELRDLYVGNDGSFLVMAFPKENIWNTPAMEAFVGELREIDPNVTGTPVQVYESSQLMRDSFIAVALYSAIAVALFVLIDFRSIVSTFFVMAPLLCGVLWMIGLMGLFDLHLNLANFFAIPILIGIGVDDAVHFYHRYLETRDVEKAMYTTGTTLTLTTMTTIVGFGSLIFASHKGLASMGALMAVGSAACWFASVVFLPALIKCLTRDGGMPSAGHGH